jgi:class 3 adenylate cyclase
MRKAEIRMRAHLSELLESRAVASFVGRGAELALLDTLFAETGPLVVHIHGIGGIGKSTLLDAFARRAGRRRSVGLIRLDCRTAEPTERGVVHAIGALLKTRVRTLASLTDRLRALGKRVVLIFDNYDLFRLADTWIRQTFVPALPANARLVLAGQGSPVSAWSTAPGWAGLCCSIVLRPLNDADADELLRRTGVPASHMARLNRFARGHPLALKLAAQTCLRNPDQALGETTAHEVVEELTRRYLGDIQDPQTTTALNAAAVVRRTTRSVLRAMLGPAVADDAFEKLSSLPFVERDRDGLFVHDAVRAAVAALLRSSDPGVYRDHRRAAWRQLSAEVRSAGLAELWRYTADLLYLIENPIVREAFFPSQMRPLIVEPARREDGPAIHAICERHESSDGTAALKRWWAALPEAFHVVRDDNGLACGFYCLLERGALKRWAPVDDDPLVRRWLDHITATPLPPDQRTLLLRRWLSADDGERPSAVQAACFLDIKRTYMELRPQLRRVYVAVRDVDVWRAALLKLGFQLLPQYDTDLNGVRHHSALLDFGPGSVDGWLAKLAGDELGADEGNLLDVSGRRLKVDGRLHALTPLEFHVLQFLMQRQGQAVSRQVLRRNVWGHRGDGASNVVDAVIRSLRKKLGARASTIETVSGVGYRFCPERVLATLLFVDVIGSAERPIALGDARWRAVLDTFHAEVRRAVARFEGRGASPAGDGVLAVFNAPVAALRTACTIRDAMAVQGISTRAGVHAGTCELIGDDVTGIAVRLAARIAAAAGAGEVLASATVRDLVTDSGIVFSDRGLHHLRGVPGKQALVAVDAAVERKPLRAASGRAAHAHRARPPGRAKRPSRGRPDRASSGRKST